MKLFAMAHGACGTAWPIVYKGIGLRSSVDLMLILIVPRRATNDGAGLLENRLVRKENMDFMNS